MTSDRWLAALDARLAQQLQFLLVADRLKSVLRGSRIADGSRRENTAEHSWHLALFSLVLREWAVGDVDPWRVGQMLILHDLVEIEAGDTPLFDADGAQPQAAREHEAADRIFGLLPRDQAATLRDLWQEFEAAVSPDAKFAKALDRLQPILLNHAVGGGTWTDYAVDVAQERGLTRRIAEGAPALWDAAEAVFADAIACGWLRPAVAAAVS
ncbi:MAG TPA: HD domain-containing protein [Acetobacteraceae bacterium]|nr:HD domain-containing protein [Acetobacteraceae bacterium]